MNPATNKHTDKRQIPPWSTGIGIETSCRQRAGSMREFKNRHVGIVPRPRCSSPIVSPLLTGGNLQISKIPLSAGSAPECDRALRVTKLQVVDQ